MSTFWTTCTLNFKNAFWRSGSGVQFEKLKNFISIMFFDELGEIYNRHFEEPVNWISKMCFGDLGVVCSLKNWKLNFFCAFWWSGRSRWCAVGKTEKLNFENAFWWSGRWLEFVDSLTWSPCKLNFKIQIDLWMHISSGDLGVDISTVWRPVN